ncbi:TRAP transporter solute receptor, TAXI family [Aurantimonas manganoxydans SI85-9A1]|uniref:TRAP transporter solute receptor, TAXI family n=1 Tax=Aurantimonas manganoxydans (strain ATCC BAA-1229 / DSM 21871 / SI85-9A1) TaxID=287752 RepID=Q1YE87_AURMS|nr:TAXI family TRAP transporter solute-binding subunit [Aurantimonas manganoxydans]EAS48512.1 TRAP transporter solute receptor, TAXI family [Aurantimonas manganoxydans SI85-9A1]
MKKTGWVAAGLAALAMSTGAATAQEKFITIGTGGQTGVYYVVGQSICRLVNRESEKNGLRCTAPSTGASVANINAIKAGDQTMGVAQSDMQYNALEGQDPWKGDPFAGERAVFSIHPEPITVVARADAGIESFDDLKGKRVNIGNPGSGSRATMEIIMDRKGWSMGDFSLASELKAAEQSQALCDNKVDAIIYTVGHPNGSIQEATTSCASKLVPVTGAEIDKLVDENPYYSKATIPGGLYEGNAEDTETFGVRATMVSSDQVDEETIYQVVKAVFENFDRFKKLHPAFENLTKEEMISAGNSAPLHPGAERYYKEAGLL